MGAVTNRRMASVVALAADYLASSTACKLTIIGAGEIARLLADALNSYTTFDASDDLESVLCACLRFGAKLVRSAL